MAQHTQGPWTQVDFVEVRAPDGQTVAWCPATDDAVDGATIAAANARLIAKSPDLYALVWGIAMYPDIKKHVAAKFPGLVEKAQALVAEIEGGT